MASAQENIDKFRAWKATIDDDSVDKYIYQGTLSKSKVAKTAGIGYSALKPENGNPQLIEEFTEFCDELRSRGVLPELKEKGCSIKSGDEVVLRNTTNRKAANAQRRSSSLEEENIALQARVKLLEDELMKYKDLGLVLDELGVILK